MGPKTKSAHLLRWHYGERVTMGQFSNSFPKHFSYLCEYAFRFDLSCSFCEYPLIFHCLHCSPSCFDPDSLLLAHLWLGLSWIYCISANKSFSSPKTSSRKPYTSSKQQERQKHSVETTINFSACVALRFRFRLFFFSDCAASNQCWYVFAVVGVLLFRTCSGFSSFLFGYARRLSSVFLFRWSC